MSEPNRNPFRCFNAPFLIASLLVALAVIGLAFLARRYAPGTPLRLTLAGAQAVLIAGLAIASVNSIRRLDELLLKVHLESIAISFALFSAFIAGWGLMERAGAPGIPWGLWAWPIMTFTWGITAVIRSRRYL